MGSVEGKNNFKNMTDEALAMLAEKGNEAAAEYLIQDYKELVKSKASLYFMFGADRDDIVQEGMIGIFKAIMNYNPGSALPTELQQHTVQYTPFNIILCDNHLCQPF